MIKLNKLFNNIFTKIQFLNRKEKLNLKKIKLDVLGISYLKDDNQNIYIVILGEDGGDRKIPVIINYFDAQSIALEIEKVTPITPFIYDTIKEILINNKINFEEILITDFKNDILYTYLSNKKQKIEIRTADALSISVRMGYPIYIYENVLEKVDSVVKKIYDIKDGKKILDTNNTNNNNLSYSKYNLDQLNDLLSEAIRDEEYEKASVIRDEIIKKNKKD